MRQVPAWVLAAVMLTGFGADAQTPVSTPKSSELRQKMQAQLESIAVRLDGVMGYTIIDLTSGERVDRLQNEVFPLASTIKLTILYELLRQADEGKLNLDEVRALDRRQVVAGTGVLAELGTPSMSLRDYATLMIVLSDNTATNVLIDVVGMRNVTARMSGAGLASLKLRRKMIDLSAARRGDENVGTPSDVAKLLGMIYRGEGLRKESAEALIGILKKAKATALRRGVDAGVEVAGKPGTLDGVESDAGIVYLPGRPYLFVAATTYLKDNAAGEAAITAASQAAFDYFSRIAKSSEYGRTIR
ncbi:MAG TPA: serine hydrolase [Vicinamibacterales bacterium]|nr:serine hydrolase [Vicinamibacterales bacterium]